jgi:hypothetical protein
LMSSLHFSKAAVLFSALTDCSRLGYMIRLGTYHCLSPEPAWIKLGFSSFQSMILFLCGIMLAILCI